DPEALAAGREVFAQFCFACHGPDGGGSMMGANLPGPNLTDNAWIYGGGGVQILGTIARGTANGMPPWGPVLGPTRTKQVAAFVTTLRGTEVPGGKPPQGEPYHGN